MAGQADIRRRIELRMSQGEFLAGMLHVASRKSAETQEGFIDQLSGIAASVRKIFEINGIISRLEYRPGQFWPSVKGVPVTFLDGGVAKLDLPSAAPVGIRVGSYTVRPGEDDPDKREQFAIMLSVVDDLYSDDALLYDNDFEDVAKLQDAARIICETAALWHAVSRRDGPDLVLLHGPLVNPASPYGLDGFPAYGEQACREFLDAPSWTGGDRDRQFVPLYLELLKRIEETGKSTLGVVERSIGKDPVVFRNILLNLQDERSIKREDAKELVESARTFGLNDSSLFDVVLEEGEYITPVAINRQGPESKWPDAWKEWIRDYPPALTTYLKASALTSPFRVEAFQNISDFERALDLVLHTSRLLPSYGFPVGLDIVDKFAKVPEWMSRGVKGQHQIVLLHKALASGDPRALTFAKRVLAAKPRDWFFRPSP